MQKEHEKMVVRIWLEAVARESGQGARTIDLEHGNISLYNKRMRIYNSRRGYRKTNKLIKIFHSPIIRETKFRSRCQVSQIIVVKVLKNDNIYCW